MQNVLRKLIKLLVFFVVLFAGLIYLGGFSAAQSIALAFLFCVVWAFVGLRTQEKLPFVPFEVFIRPKFRAIARDFELVQDLEEEWAKLWKAIEELPDEPWNIWNSGFAFSVITPQLVFQHGWNRFATEPKMSASMEPVVTLRDGQQVDEGSFLRPFSPRLELGASADGYRIKLIVIEDLWNRIDRALRS
jgi:hypothetical protein